MYFWFVCGILHISNDERAWKDPKTETLKSLIFTQPVVFFFFISTLKNKRKVKYKIIETIIKINE